MKKHFTQATIKANSINTEDYTIEFVSTIEVKDRHGDMVHVDSMDFTDFDKNPVVLPQHKHNELSIGAVVEHYTEMIDGKKAKIMKVKFAVEQYELAKTYFNLYAGGFMHAVSLGFIPERGEEIDGVFVLFGAKILELSCVSIPANQLALAKSKGLDIQEVITLNKDTMLAEAKSLMVTAQDLIKIVDDNSETETPEEAPVVTAGLECTGNKCCGECTPDEPTPPTPEQKKAESRKRAFNNIAKALRQM